MNLMTSKGCVFTKLAFPLSTDESETTPPNKQPGIMLRPNSRKRTATMPSAHSWLYVCVCGMTILYTSILTPQVLLVTSGYILKHASCNQTTYHPTPYNPIHQFINFNTEGMVVSSCHPHGPWRLHRKYHKDMVLGCSWDSNAPAVQVWGRETC